MQVLGVLLPDEISRASEATTENPRQSPTLFKTLPFQPVYISKGIVENLLNANFCHPCLTKRKCLEEKRAPCRSGAPIKSPELFSAAERLLFWLR